MPDNKYEREIDEILKKIDDFPRHAAQRRRVSGKFARRVGELQRAFTVRLARVSISQVMLISIGVMVISLFLRGTAGKYGLILGLILFFTAFALSYRTGAGGGGEPFHRGKPKSYYGSSSSGSPVRSLRDWWRRQRGSRRP